MHKDLTQEEAGELYLKGKLDALGQLLGSDKSQNPFEINHTVKLRDYAIVAKIGLGTDETQVVTRVSIDLVYTNLCPRPVNYNHYERVK